MRLATAAIYAQPWFNWNNFPLLGIGDIMSGNMLQPYNSDLVQFTTFSITSNNSYVTQAWQGFFDIVAHCDVNIKAINTKLPDSVSAASKNAALGELKIFTCYRLFSPSTVMGGSAYY